MRKDGSWFLDSKLPHFTFALRINLSCIFAQIIHMSKKKNSSSIVKVLTQMVLDIFEQNGNTPLITNKFLPN